MLIPDLEPVAARWPGFVSAAIAAGARAMFALPLQAGAIRVGVLTLYRAKPGALAPEALADGLVLADVALQLILDAAAGVSGLPENQPLAALSDRRAEVYQAIGMVSVQLGVSLEDAFVRLRAHAFADGRALADVADDVVTRVLRFSPDPSPSPAAQRPSRSRDGRDAGGPDRDVRTTVRQWPQPWTSVCPQTFVELADTLVAGYDLMEFLQTLTERCVELLEVNAAGLLLADAGARSRWSPRPPSRPASSSCSRSSSTRAPAWTASAPGRPSSSATSAPEAAARWPRFAAAAQAAGFAGVHAIPMRLRDEVIGTLNLFSTAPGGLDPAVARAARTLVDVATIGILQERAIHQQELVASQLQVALNSRVVIEQAKGILAERLQTTPDEAFLLLRRYARNHNHPLTQLAADVIHGTAPIVS